MSSHARQLNLLRASGEEPLFQPGDTVRVSSRSPVGHYRVPAYLRGKQGLVERIISPRGIDNEEEATGETPASSGTTTAIRIR